MVSWLVRGKTFAVSKKQNKNKIQNKQTEKIQTLSCGDHVKSWNTGIIYQGLNELYFPKEKMWKNLRAA